MNTKVSAATANTAVPAYLADYTDRQKAVLREVLNPISRRAKEVGLEQAISESSHQMTTKQRATVVDKLQPGDVEGLITTVSGEDRSTIMALLVLFIRAQGWKGELIQ